MNFVNVEGFHATPTKTAYENSFKNLGAIQRSDQKLWTFSTGTMVALVVCPKGRRRRGEVIHATPRKTAYGNSINLGVIQQSDQKL
jgi:hypothetical protein